MSPTYTLAVDFNSTLVFGQLNWYFWTLYKPPNTSHKPIIKQYGIIITLPYLVYDVLAQKDTSNKFTALKMLEPKTQWSIIWGSLR